jgi:hypothetical protein
MPIIKLDYPIAVGGKEVTQLEMRRPLVRDLMIAGKISNPAESEISLVANLCGLSPDELQQLDGADYTELQSQLLAMQKKRSGQTTPE